MDAALLTGLQDTSTAAGAAGPSGPDPTAPSQTLGNKAEPHRKPGVALRLRPHAGHPGGKRPPPPSCLAPESSPSTCTQPTALLVSGPSKPGHDGPVTRASRGHSQPGHWAQAATGPSGAGSLCFPLPWCGGPAQRQPVTHCKNLSVPPSCAHPHACTHTHKCKLAPAPACKAQIQP